MKTIMMIMTSLMVLGSYNYSFAQQTPEINETDVLDSTGPYNPVDTFIDVGDDPMLNLPPGNTAPNEPTIVPNTQPEAPGQPHPGTTVEPKQGSAFNQGSFMRSIGKGGGCSDGTCALNIVSNKSNSE